MKYVLIKLIKTYQAVPGNFHNQCRHIPTCSNYALEAITEYGSLKGGFMSAVRILKCNPLFKSGYDPVIKKGDKHEKNDKDNNN